MEVEVRTEEGTVNQRIQKWLGPVQKAIGSIKCKESEAVEL